MYGTTYMYDVRVCTVNRTHRLHTGMYYYYIHVCTHTRTTCTGTAYIIHTYLYIHTYTYKHVCMYVVRTVTGITIDSLFFFAIYYMSRYVQDLVPVSVSTIGSPDFTAD